MAETTTTTATAAAPKTGVSPVKRVKKASTYNIMVAGASGLGKTTFIRTLLEDSSFVPRDEDEPKMLTEHKTTEIRSFSTEIDIDRKKIAFSIIDTPGFGDLIDNSKSFQIVANYVEEQFQAFLKEESRIQRNAKFLDPRVHVILYFIAPNGHGLTQLDVSFMRRLGTRANVIPIIAKADTLSPTELEWFKQRIRKDIEDNVIEIFDFPYSSDIDDDIADENDYLESILPFAIIGSEKEYNVNGEMVRGRQYPWGLVEVENEEHCDFLRLRNALFVTHLDDLKDITQDVHYEAFRKADLIKRGNRDSSLLEDMMPLKGDAQMRKDATLKRRKTKREGATPTTDSPAV